MKTLIKTYYREPQVDSVRILWYIREQNSRNSFYNIFLLPMITIGILLLVFFYFLLGLNFDFLSTVLSLYYTVGSILFVIGNLVIGISVFIMEYGILLTYMIIIIALVQIWILSYMRSSFQRV